MQVDKLVGWQCYSELYIQQSDSYVVHNETVTPLNIATPKISLKEKFDTFKIKFINDFESMKESFFFGNIFIQNGNVADKKD